MWYVINEDELYHHGIKGQKWGVRRFQNADGTLTKAGQKRYAKQQQRDADFAEAMKLAKQYDEEAAAKKSEARARREAKRQQKSDVQNRRTLSDKELRDKIQRLQMEKQLKDLSDRDLRSGRTEAKHMLQQVGTKVAATVLTGALLYGAKYVVEKQGNKNSTSDYIKSLSDEELKSAVDRFRLEKDYKELSSPSGRGDRVDYQQLADAVFNGGPKKKK